MNFRYTHPNGFEFFIEDIFKDMGIKYTLVEENYFVKVGESNCMFTCHLDTVGKRTKINLVKDGRFLRTDGKSILGADDKAGIMVLLHMIENRVSGNYLFFVGEEVGGIGSSALSKTDFVKKYGIKKVISFDRRGYSDIIVTQSGIDCVSDAFFRALSDEFSKCGLFMTEGHGSFTDSYNFINIVPECTNISVGYFNEHTKKEYLDLAYLKKLKEVVVKIAWESLPAERVLEPWDNVVWGLEGGYEIENYQDSAFLFLDGVDFGIGFVENSEVFIYAYSVLDLNRLKKDIELFDLPINLVYDELDEWERV